MARKRRNKKPRKPRNMVVLGMILARKGGIMGDRRTKRKARAERDDISDRLEAAQP